MRMVPSAPDHAWPYCVGNLYDVPLLSFHGLTYPLNVRFVLGLAVQVSRVLPIRRMLGVVGGAG